MLPPFLGGSVVYWKDYGPWMYRNLFKPSSGTLLAEDLGQLNLPDAQFLHL